MNDILNFVQLIPRVGTSGQPKEDQFNIISELEYKVVINLAMPDSDGAIENEGKIVTSLGMDYVHIPVPFDSPSIEHLKKFIGIMKVYENDKAWVHCAVNARVSAFMYHYLSKCVGLTESESRSVVLDHWEPQMDSTWASFMKLTNNELI